MGTSRLFNLNAAFSHLGFYRINVTSAPSFTLVQHGSDTWRDSGGTYRCHTHMTLLLCVVILFFLAEEKIAEFEDRVRKPAHLDALARRGFLPASIRPSRVICNLLEVWPKFPRETDFHVQQSSPHPGGRLRASLSQLAELRRVPAKVWDSVTETAVGLLHSQTMVSVRLYYVYMSEEAALPQSN